MRPAFVIRYAARFTVAAICIFTAWRATRIAWADWLATSGALQTLDRAIQIEPGDGRMLATSAIYRSDNGDASTAVDRDLQRASGLSPLDSQIFITLGLRAEFRGDNAAAERFLIHAADLDRQFRPAWTLAGFYFRTGHPEKMWPLVARLLALDPLGFDPSPVFDLCWQATQDPTQIRRLVPSPRLVQYLDYLMRTNRPDAALDVWPAARAAANPPLDAAAALAPFPGFLVNAGRVAQAVDAWDELVTRGIVHSGRLDPAAGISIADPGFAFPSDGVFSWQLGSGDGVFATAGPGGLRAEFDGNEAESLRLASTLAPVRPGREYRLVWNADGSRLASPGDPGFAFRLSPPAPAAPVQCAPMLADNPANACVFTAGPETQTVRVDLVYARAPGTVRAQGSLRVLTVALRLVP